MMQKAITKFTIPAYLENLNDEWWNTSKLSDEWLDRIFPELYQLLNVDVGANFIRDYHQLILIINEKDIDIEVTEKLDTIYNLLNVT
jgi:hypothetical protein